jgi:hypothetical protein
VQAAAPLRRHPPQLVARTRQIALKLELQTATAAQQPRSHC